MRFVSFIFIVLFASTLSFDATAKKTYVSHSLNGHTLTVVHSEGQIDITALHDNAFEIRPLANPFVRADFPSFAKDPKQNYRPKLKVINSKSSLAFSTNALKVSIDKTTMQLSYFKNEQLLLSEESGFFGSHSLQGFRFQLDETERLMGTGERVLGMDRRGHKLPLYNRAHYGYGTHSEQMNFSIPAVMSSKKYIVLYDNPAKGFIDIGKTESDILQFESVGGRQAYIFVAGNDYPDLIHQYVKVTGTQPLPPLWAFGNHASRFGYRNQKEVVETIKSFREKDIPVDSIILDLYWFGKDIQGHMGNLEWDQSAFPDPNAMLNELNDLKVKTSLITEPFILNTSKRWQEAIDNNVLTKNITGDKVKTYDFYFGHTGLIDVFSNDAQDWFKTIYHDIATQGVSGVWGDLGEPEVHPADMLHTLSEAGITASANEVHNAFGHQWAKLVNESLNEVMPNERQFILMRSGFAGSQRYGMIPWTGDVSRSWDGLKPQPELTMQMGLLGLAYTHSDLGGFAGGEAFDKEMYIRWLQYGVFQPIYRPHAQDNIAPEPIFHDEETQQIIKRFITLRYQLLPYLYSMAYQNSMTGLPLMRPMFFDNDTPEFQAETQQFMWGDAFLVKLVAEPDLASIKVKLPKGQWTDFWTKQVYQGGQEIEYPLSLNTIPVFVKGGSIVPTTNAVMTTADYSTESLNLDVYYDQSQLSATTTIYNDDGISQDSIATGKFEKLIVNGAAHQLNGSPRYALSLEKQLGAANGYTGMPLNRTFNITVNHWPTMPISIDVAGAEIALFNNKQEFKLAQRGAFYNKAQQRIEIKFAWNANTRRVLVTNKIANQKMMMTIR